MSSLEFEEKNVDRAVKKACKDLNMTQDEIRYEVLSYGSSGIFGLAGAKKARIRVTIPEKTLVSETVIEAQPENVDQKVESSADRRSAGDYLSENREFASKQPDTFPENPLDLGRTVLQHIVGFINPDVL